MPVSVSHEVAPIWREYERSSTDDRRRLPEAAARPLRRRASTGRCATPGMARAVDDHEVERRRDARRRGGGHADPDRDVRPRRRHDREPQHVAQRLRRAERAHARHGRHERRRRHRRRRRAAAHHRVRDRVGPAGCRAADRHQVDRRRRRLDRLGRRAAASCASGREAPGAQPGPICYGRGGTRPTVTDANLLLGRLDPGYFLAGPHAARPRERARARWRRSASGRDLDPLELAASIVEIANENMASAIKMVSLERGHDPRRFALLAFGGAGPLHAAAVARALGHPAGDRAAAIPGVLLGARAAARRHPRRQGLDAGVPLERRRRGARRPRSSSGSRERARRRAPAGGLRRRAGDRGARSTCATSGQNYEHEVEIADGRARRRPRSSAAFRRFDELHAAALRLRDRGRGDRARQLQGDRDRRRRRRALDRSTPTSATEARALDAAVYFRGHGCAADGDRRRTARRSSPASAIAGPCRDRGGGLDDAASSPGMTRRAHRARRAR